MKRRKWDVAAPVPAAGVAPARAAAPSAPQPQVQQPVVNPVLVGTRAGIGNAGVTSVGHPAYGGSAGAAGAAAAGTTALPKVEVPTDYKPGRPLNEDMVKKIQASAAAVVEQLNRVRTPRMLTGWPWLASAEYTRRAAASCDPQPAKRSCFA